MISPKKAVLVAAGSVCLALAVLGVFLPLLPTTPFLLLASACYVRSSERLHGWLMGNRMLGPYIRNFKERRGIPLRGRIVTVVLLWLPLLYSVYRLELLWLEALLVLMGVTWSVLILRMRAAGEGR
ncbi:MAG TPA: YbaN family protein [Pyrinomonadaceae bacterium]|nr:YbaN family protein [Pyrinomonadaceae bacterium]